MKKLLILFTAIFTMTMANAQNTNYENSRKVSTRGYAEREITPDIIYLNISLKEYFLDGNSKKKMTIEVLERQLFEAAMAIGVKKEDFTIQNIYSYNYDNNTKKKNTELLQAKQFRVKISNLNGINSMLDKVDAKGLESTSINGYDHSQKRQIEKELKTAAVHDARANAEIIAAATGDKIGKVIGINDNSSFGWNDVMPRMYSMKADMASGDAMQQDLDISIRPIKLVCNIDGIFELY